MRRLYNWNTASTYCGFAESEKEYFKNLCATGAGPRCVRPSPRKTLFWEQDLDAWMASWARPDAMPTATAKTAV